ncbi:MAG: hypothetical protein WHX52_21540 [Anaerolineae bacterium]
MPNAKTDQEWQKEIDQLKADHALDITLLRTQLQSSQMRLATKVRALQRAEAILQDYLTALYPHLYAQALGARMSTVEAGEYFYQHYLYGNDPAELFGLCEARQQAEVDRARSAPSAPPVVVEPGVELSGDAVKLLYILGLTVLADEVKPLWVQHTGKAVGTAKNIVFPELLDKGLLQVQQIPAPGHLTGYASDTCYVLTEAGQAEYRRRFNSDPITYAAAYSPYKSPEAWWMIRATKALILAGNALPANHRFTYTVYDPERDGEAMAAVDFTPRYGNSKPDLIVVITPRSGGDALWLAVECERGNYNSTRLRHKLLKNMQDYALAGFSGCYYIANNRDTARVLGGAISRIRDELQRQPEAVTTSSFLALFTLEALRETWLPTPRFILTEFFDRKLRQPNANWPADAARPERYFKYTPVEKEAGSKGQEAGSRMQDAGSKGQDMEDEEEDVGGALPEAEDEWADEESAE